jgi:integrase
MRPISWRAFRASVLAVYDGPGHAPRTRRKIQTVLDQLEELAAARSTADLTTETIARFVRARSSRVCPNTVRGELSYVSAICAYAYDEGWLDRTPRLRRIRPRASPTVSPRAHSLADVARVLELLRSRSADWAWARLHALTALVAYTALRRDEALYLMVEDVDLTAGRIAIVARRRLKTPGSEDTVPICPELAEVLAGWLPRCGSVWVIPCLVKRSRPWVGGEYGRRPTDQLGAVGRELGIEGLTLLSLRHTWATWARRRWGLSALDVQRILRHTSPRTQEWYLHDDPDPDAIVRSAARVSYGDPGAGGLVLAGGPR